LPQVDPQVVQACSGGLRPLRRAGHNRPDTINLDPNTRLGSIGEKTRLCTYADVAEIAKIATINVMFIGGPDREVAAQSRNSSLRLPRAVTKQ